MPKTATYIMSAHDMRGDARLYRVSPTITYRPLGEEYHLSTDYVIVSAVVVAFGGGPETYIFPADNGGNVIDWGELDGSLKGALDHAQALTDAGYTIEED